MIGNSMHLLQSVDQLQYNIHHNPLRGLVLGLSAAGGLSAAAACSDWNSDVQSVAREVGTGCRELGSRNSKGPGKAVAAVNCFQRCSVDSFSGCC